jgi:NDP-sugar pyrophosphorylase family protein
VRGFVLAAGFGTRLRPITDHIPKALVTVCGRPLLELSLSFLEKSGIDTVGVNAHYLADQLFKYQRSSSFNFELFHEKEAIRGTGGALDFARGFLAGDDLFFVCNVDIVYDLDLSPIIEKFENSDLSCGLLAVKPVSRGAGGSIYFREDDGRYAGVPAEGEPVRGSVPADFIGAALYRKEFLEIVTRDDFSIVPVWKRAAARGLKTGVIVVDKCYWRDIGTPASLANAHFDRLKGALSLEVPEHLVLDIAGKRCTHRRLPEYLLRNIGQFAWVETENVPDGCAITHSVVQQGAVLPHAATVDRKIITRYGEVSFE